MRCDLSRLLSRKITKHIHSSKPASLNCPIVQHLEGMFELIEEHVNSDMFWASAFFPFWSLLTGKYWEWPFEKVFLKREWAFLILGVVKAYTDRGQRQNCVNGSVAGFGFDAMHQAVKPISSYSLWKLIVLSQLTQSVCCFGSLDDMLWNSLSASDSFGFYCHVLEWLWLTCYYGTNLLIISEDFFSFQNDLTRVLSLCIL